MACATTKSLGLRLRADPNSTAKTPERSRTWPQHCTLRERLRCCSRLWLFLARYARDGGTPVGLWLLSPLLFLGAQSYAAETDASALALRAFWRAQAQYTNQPQNVQAAWEFGRACFDVAEVATNSAERALMAERGIAACRQLLSTNSNCAPAHYYLGLNLGELARSRGLGALKLVNEMERELSTAVKLDPSFDFGGPDRSLGMLYRDTPALISLGSRSKARQHLQRAIGLAPNFPENRLDLIESDLKWNDRNSAQREIKALEELWPRARAEFGGPAWTLSWNDWGARLQKVKANLQESAKFEDLQR